MDDVFFTTKGLDKFKSDLSLLKVELIEAGARLGDAAGINCDWHDNFEYEDARRQMDMISMRVAETEDVLRKAVVVNFDKTPSIVSIGTTVICYVDGDKKEYTIGGYGENTVNIGLLSYQSPFAQAILGKEVGDIQHVLIANHTKEIEIEKILSHKYKYDKISILING